MLKLVLFVFVLVSALGFAPSYAAAVEKPASERAKTFEGVIAVGVRLDALTGRSVAFMWSEGKKVWTSPAAQSWFVAGAELVAVDPSAVVPPPKSMPETKSNDRANAQTKPRSAEKTRVRFWGWKSVAAASQPFVATLEFDRGSESSNPQLSMRTFETASFAFERFVVAGSWRAAIGKNAFGNSVVELWNAERKVGSWSWDEDVSLNQIALSPDGAWAVCGFESNPPVPFLWANEKIVAPTGWRGRLETLRWTSRGLWAVGRGAPGDLVPVRPLAYQGGGWQSLDVDSAGSFPLLIAELPVASEDPELEPKLSTTLVGVLAQKTTGAFQVWSVSEGALDVKPLALKTARPGGIVVGQDGAWTLWGSFAETDDDVESTGLWGEEGISAFEGLTPEDRIVSVVRSTSAKK